MSSEGRFGRLSDAEMEKMMSDKDAVNTKRATKAAIQSLREYTFETDSAKMLNTNPLQNIRGSFTPYITNSVVNFTINMSN
jgi:hypothetical protein